MEAESIPPFQVHLMLKLERGQPLTPNEILRAQQMGIDDPMFSASSPQPGNGSAGDERDDSGQKKQKTETAKGPNDDNAQEGRTSTQPTQKCYRPVAWPPCHPHCWYAPMTKFAIPDWKVHPEKYPNGPPVPPWVHVNWSSRQVQPGQNEDAQNGEERRWAQPAQAYPRYIPWDGADRFRGGFHSHYTVPDLPRIGWSLPASQYRPTERNPDGSPIPHGWDGSGPVIPSYGGGNYPFRLAMYGNPLPHPWDGTQARPTWWSHAHWAIPQEGLRPTQRDQYGRPLGHDWDGAHIYYPSSHWAIPQEGLRPTQRDQYGRPLGHDWDGAHIYYPSSHLAQQTRTYPTHIPHWPGSYGIGFPDPNWRQVITTTPQGVVEDPPTFNGAPVLPSHTYSWRGNGVALRVGTGGADQSGLLVKLCDQYIQECVEVNQETPFLVEFYASDSAITIDYLAENIVDVGFTDTIFLDTLVKDQKVFSRRETGWRGHWMLVGPADNPAGLAEKTNGSSLHALFATLYTQLQAAPDSQAIFLSRSDSSSSYIKESSIWSAIGRTPSTSTSATWYASSNSSASETLAEAAMIGAYTLTDSDTWYSASEETRSKLTLFTLESDAQDALSKPVELVVGNKAKNEDRANDFVEWLIREDGGQAVIKTFSTSRASGSESATDAKGEPAQGKKTNEV